MSFFVIKFSKKINSLIFQYLTLKRPYSLNKTPYILFINPIPKMNLQLEDQVFRWLFSLNILSAKVRKLKNGKIEIPLSQTTSLEIGHLFLKLLHSINTSKKLNLKLPQPLALKNFSTPQDRIYNWTVLGDTLQMMGYSLNPETKRLIISGNTPKLAELLKELLLFFNPEQGPTAQGGNDISGIINSSVSKSMITNESLLKNQQSVTNVIGNSKEVIDITTVDATKPLEKTESLLEFMIVGLSQSLNLKPSQVSIE